MAVEQNLKIFILYTLHIIYLFSSKRKLNKNYNLNSIKITVKQNR